MRIYSYGAFASIESNEIVEHQLRLGNTYNKVLVIIERDRRVAIETLYRGAAPVEYAAYVAASTAVVAAIDAVRISRSTSGDILQPDDDMKAERREIFKAAATALEIAKEGEKVARQAWSDARRAATPGLKENLKALDTDAYAKNKYAYNAAATVGLDWGTRLRIGQFVELAAKASIKEAFWLIGDLADTREARRELRGSLPRIPRFDGGGTIAVQLQGGLDPAFVAHATSPSFGPQLQVDTQFRIDVADAGTWQMLRGKSAFTATKKDGRVVDLPQPGMYTSVKKNGTVVALPKPDPNSKRSLRKAEHENDRIAGGIRAIVRLRVGSNGRAPIWAAWPVILHRPLPEGAPIKWVEMHARKIGPRTEWQLLVTVDDEQPAKRTEGPTLAVNLGWRNLPDLHEHVGEIRVAYAVGSDGYEEEVRVPVAYVSGVAHVESLTGIRKKLFNEAVKVLDDWIEDGERPKWLLHSVRNRDKWLSPKKLVFFMMDWEKNRFDGDAKMWEVFAAWRKKDRHLWFWESDERQKLLRMRKDFYRNVAARWAEKYAHILITDMDLREFAELPEPEEGSDAKDKVQRITQKMAAPSELRAAIVNACSTRGTCCPNRVQRGKKLVVEGSCAGHVPLAEKVLGIFATQTCNTCKVVVRFNARAELVHTCYECKATWDQDANHCRNLLASDEVMREQAPSLAPTGEVGENGGSAKKIGRWQKRRSQKMEQLAENPPVSK